MQIRRARRTVRARIKKYLEGETQIGSQTSGVEALRGRYQRIYIPKTTVGSNTGRVSCFSSIQRRSFRRIALSKFSILNSQFAQKSPNPADAVCHFFLAFSLHHFDEGGIHDASKIER